ncbi:uncharacterized protein BKCO1_3000119 [Diplodia corticola]|uniref:F-box domain-containing protein n=1 Tax=Diplodia corticola TaxID=236234 RepID=A0A1J9SEU8_9PEZI|nr:uncharacterized protein BKCO1_3000119 [Diplodia corticola]OJD38935.1 hypothetical protein BKCO1_3000119 [Diplodia corticola]
MAQILQSLRSFFLGCIFGEAAATDNLRTKDAAAIDNLRTKDAAPPYAPAVTHNIDHSFLHRLPLDILYYLATHHIPDPIDLLALRTSTRALFFSPIIRSPFIKYDANVAYEYLQRLRRDDFMRACEAERQEHGPEQQELVSCSTTTRTSLLHPCSSCQSMHPRARFSAAQLAVGTRHSSRRCNATIGAIRICPHATYTLADLRRIDQDRVAAARGSRHNDTFWWTCGECKYNTNTTLMGLMDFPYRTGMHTWFSATREVDLAGRVGDGNCSPVVDAETCFTPELVMAVLKAAADRYSLFLCNHVRLGDPETYESEWGRLGRYGGQVSKISSHRCPRSTCQVEAYLYWTSGYGSDPRAHAFPIVHLTIKRFIKGPLAKSDETWLAQIEEVKER